MPQFRNLVFEGGGVKGIAYVGAMEVLETKGILPEIERVGGTSAGAINALLFALDFSNKAQQEILAELDFNKFMDDSFGVVRDTKRLIEEFGWHKGDFFHDWAGSLINDKIGTRNATFRDLEAAERPSLYLFGTNLSTGFSQAFSLEHTPTTRLADAVRISMSLPLFFAAVRDARRDVFVDGGVLNNFPIKLFDRKKYIAEKDQAACARDTEYYKTENDRFLATRPGGSPYVYNRQTLGFRLDTKQEIAAFRYGREPAHHRIDDFFDYTKALIKTALNAQENMHLHGDDWQRTVYIDTLDVKTTDFDLSDAKKKALLKSGRACTERYFSWFEKATGDDAPINRI